MDQGGPPRGFPPGVNVQAAQKSRHTREQLKIKDALKYLDEVKMEFESRPFIYNQFLDIMKGFKDKTVDMPGVIHRVKTLFKDYERLIYGFNTFLPDGFKIEKIDRPNEQADGAQQQQMYPTPMMQQMPGDMASRQMGSAPPPIAPAQAGGAPASNQQPVEFDHAINYVTTIKKRFSQEPDTYRQFLDILHTYQQEQRSIKEVLEQVSYLFRDHPDLLKEFTFFLPDAVQEQAKERLNRAARESEHRKLNQQRMKRGLPPLSDDGVPLVGTGGRGAGKRRDEWEGRGRDDRRDDGRGDYRSGPQRRGARGGGADGRRSGFNKKRSHDGMRRGGVLRENIETKGAGRMSEKRLFERVHETLSPRDWVDFLKMVELVSKEIIPRHEATTMMESLVGSNHHLYEEFQQSLTGRTGAAPSTQEEMLNSMPLSEIDFNDADRCTPSYRSLPAAFAVPQSSARGELEDSVCNDVWVSVPTGSEDFSFKNMRRNQYEEALFKCEDERFEVDMVIAANESAIRALEPLVADIKKLKEHEKEEPSSGPWQYVLDAHSLNVIQLKAMTRVYGDQGGSVLQLLRKNPAGAIPIILARLKQKDEEWKKARYEMNKHWKDVLDKNFVKSLDHRSFYFKQTDKRVTAYKALVGEVKDAHEEVDRQRAKEQKEKEKKKKEQEAKAEGSAMEVEAEEDESTSAAKPWAPHIKFDCTWPGVHKEVMSLLSEAAEATLSTSEKERVALTLRNFVRVFFCLPSTVFPDRPDVNPAGVVEGAKVMTAYGKGEVVAIREDGVVEVKLGFGVASLQRDTVHGCPVEFGAPVRARANEPAALPLIDPSDASVAGSPTQPFGVEVFYGTSSAYVFLRLYHILYSRLALAQQLSAETKDKKVAHPLMGDRLSGNAKKAAGKAGADSNGSGSEAGVGAGDGGDGSSTEGGGDRDSLPDVAYDDDYQAFRACVSEMVATKLDTKFEEECHRLMGTPSYQFFTLDKLIANTLRNLVSMSTEEGLRLQELYRFERARSLAAVPAVYRHNATLVANDNTELYRLEYSPGVTAHAYAGGAVVRPKPEPCSTNHDAEVVAGPMSGLWEEVPVLAMEHLGILDAHAALDADTPVVGPRVEEDDEEDDAKSEGVDGKEDDKSEADVDTDREGEGEGDDGEGDAEGDVANGTDLDSEKMEVDDEEDEDDLASTKELGSEQDMFDEEDGARSLKRLKPN